MTTAKRQTVTIEKVITGGQGLARLASGLVVMVPFVLPGETVAVALGKPKKGFVEATLLEVLVAAPQRVEPHCPHFRDCGGCHLQHCAYPGQLAIKEAILGDVLSRQLGAAEMARPLCPPILASPQPFHYRQRVRLQVGEQGQLGFFARRSHEVVAIDSCPLAVLEINQVLAAGAGLAAFRSLLKQAEALELLSSPLAGQVELIVHLARRPRAADQQAARAVCDGVGLVRAVWLAGEGFATSGPYGTARGENVAGEGLAFALPEDVGGRRLILRLEAGGFCQVNLAQNERLLRQLLDWAQVGQHDRVLDLFCGMGNFSLPLALACRQVVGTDVQRSSIRGAEANALANQLENCLFLRKDALAAVRDLHKAKERFDLILLDPPRAGCRDLIPLLPELGAERLIYISCDPATLARDLAQLHGVGFVLDAIRGVDMFPQTSHLETIALLIRR